LKGARAVPKVTESTSAKQVYRGLGGEDLLSFIDIAATGFLEREAKKHLDQPEVEWRFLSMLVS